MPDMIPSEPFVACCPTKRRAAAVEPFATSVLRSAAPATSGDLPEGHQHGDDSKFRRDLPDRYIRLGDVSADLGAPAHRWTGGDQ